MAIYRVKGNWGKRARVMIIKVLKSIILGTPSDATTEGGKASGKGSKNQPIDLVHEAMRRDAGQLHGLVSSGLSQSERRRLKDRVKKKVKQNILPHLDTDEVVEEVTEKILDAAEFDPMYSETFKDEDK